MDFKKRRKLNKHISRNFEEKRTPEQIRISAAAKSKIRDNYHILEQALANRGYIAAYADAVRVLGQNVVDLAIADGKVKKMKIKRRYANKQRLDEIIDVIVSPKYDGKSRPAWLDK